MLFNVKNWILTKKLEVLVNLSLFAKLTADGQVVVENSISSAVQNTYLATGRIEKNTHGLNILKKC